MIQALDKKLFRDLYRIKGQAMAIGLVIAVGVMMLVMMTGLVNTLEETRRAYYERYRFADMFAPVKRAPETVLKKLAELPGVTRVEGRVVGSALVDLPAVDVPLQARAISLPDFHAPRLNDIYLSSGRRLTAERSDEIILLKGFADAHGLVPGDRLAATMNGLRRQFHIVGLAESPEFLYTTAPGEIVPDDSRFAVIWMSQSALSAAYDMDGAFNEALIATDSKATTLKALLSAVDRLLDPYGNRGAYGVEDQISNRFISEEIKGQRISSAFVPPIFLAVAAFLLYIAVSRIVQSEREQIGLLKAFGYSSLEVSIHYLKMVIIIAVLGAMVGSLLGVLAGRSLAGVYQLYYKFPFLVFQLDPRAFIIGFVTSITTASLGGLVVLKQVFNLTPAVAMRPPAPADYSKTARLPAVMQGADQPTRMVLRRLARQPGRMMGAVIGIASGMALSVAMLNVMSGFDTTLDLTFSAIDRSDATVSFIHPMAERSLYDLEAVDGVLTAEPFRMVSVVFHHGRNEYRGSIHGLRAGGKLYRALDKQMQPIAMPKGGLVLSKPVADMLGAGIGDRITVDVRQGRRPTLHLPVVQITETLLGAPTYMELTSLNRQLKEHGRVSGAYLTLDEDRAGDVYKAIKDMSAVAGVSLKEDSMKAFQKVMDSGAGAMRYVMALIAGVITFGIVYNAARIAFAERSRDLASLRVIGFTKAETAFVLLGELGVVTFCSLPLGGVLGYYLTFAVSKGFSTDIYQIPVEFSANSYGTAILAVLVASTLSGLAVKKQMDQLDMVSALKTRE